MKKKLNKKEFLTVDDLNIGLWDLQSQTLAVGYISAVIQRNKKNQKKFLKAIILNLKLRKLFKEIKIDFIKEQSDLQCD
jgi:hypothetical protein